ncbi:unnamed protein product, partial [Strongylus vulgaris]
MSPKKNNRISLYEPPLLALPQSPAQRENYYVMDASFALMSTDEEPEAEKTVYE